MPGVPLKLSYVGSLPATPPTSSAQTLEKKAGKLSNKIDSYLVKAQTHSSTRTSMDELKDEAQRCPLMQRQIPNLN